MLDCACQEGWSCDGATSSLYLGSAATAYPSIWPSPRNNGESAGPERGRLMSRARTWRSNTPRIQETTHARQLMDVGSSVDLHIGLARSGAKPGHLIFDPGLRSGGGKS